MDAKKDVRQRRLPEPVKVYSRIRPMTDEEISKGQPSSLRVRGNCIQIGKKQFEFDMCFSSLQGQEQSGDQTDLFNHIGPSMLESALQGYNTSLFAYGQTGSGKTYSMMGSPDAKGFIPSFVTELFRCMNSAQGEEDPACEENWLSGAKKVLIDGKWHSVSYRVHARFFEVYCERAFDLLNKNAEVKIRDTDKVDGISERVVASPEAVLELLRRGEMNRSTASTKKNERSSRSHAVFQLRVQKHTVALEGEAGRARPQTTVSTVSLVDLAGSERVKTSGAEGERFKEMININQSLTPLRRVIQHLHDNPGGLSKPPVRDALLTKALASSFGGNSRTILLVALSPSCEDEKDTVSTLEFSDIARKVVNDPTINVDGSTLMLRAMSDEIARLRATLEDQTREKAEALRRAAELAAVVDRIDDQSSKRCERGIMTEQWVHEELEDRLVQLTTMQQGMEAQLATTVADADELTVRLADEEERCAALKRQVEDIQRHFHRDVVDLFKSKKELQNVMTQISAPLKERAGCPQCQASKIEVSTTVMYNHALQQELELMTVQQEELYIANERLRKKNTALQGQLGSMRGSITVQQDWSAVVLQQKERIEEMQQQLEAYVNDRIALTMELHATKALSSRSPDDHVDVIALGLSGKQQFEKWFAVAKGKTAVPHTA